MTRKLLFLTGCCLAALLISAPSVFAADIDRISRQVARLKIERSGYTLGKALTGGQLAIARKNPVESTVPGTFKFQDRNLFIVAQEKNNRVLIMYERFEKATQQKAQNVIGDLYMTFEEPTVLAHEQVVYWAYSKKGKISSKAFDTAKKEKEKIEIMATVKYISDVKLMSKAKGTAEGLVYYIISSDPLLQFFRDKKKTL